jgi:hypothetical protein
MKKMDVKSSHFQKVDFLIFKRRHLRRKDRPWKKSHFFEAHFSCERNGQPNFKFDIDSEVLFIYRLIPRKPTLFGRIAIFYTTPIVRFLRASRSVHGRIQRKGADVWASVNRYALHHAACKF